MAIVRITLEEIFLSDKAISPSTKLVYGWLKQKKRFKGKDIDIAVAVGISRRTVASSLKLLDDLGLIVRKRVALTGKPNGREIQA